MLLLLILNIFHTFFWRFYCRLRTSKCWLERTWKKDLTIGLRLKGLTQYSRKKFHQHIYKTYIYLFLIAPYPYLFLASLNCSLSEAYLGPCQVSTIKLFCKNSPRLLVANFFRKKGTSITEQSIQLWMSFLFVPVDLDSLHKFSCYVGKLFYFQFISMLSFQF